MDVTLRLLQYCTANCSGQADVLMLSIEQLRSGESASLFGHLDGLKIMD